MSHMLLIVEPAGQRGTRTEAQIVSGMSMQSLNIRGIGYLSAVIFAPKLIDLANP